VAVLLVGDCPRPALGNDSRNAKNPGAFSAAPKTGLCGGSAACAADGHLRWPRPSNPLRSQHPLPGVSPIPVRSFAYTKLRKKSCVANLGGQYEKRREICVLRKFHGRTRRCADASPFDEGCPRSAFGLRRTGFPSHLIPQPVHMCHFLAKSSEKPA
jgi:hypothetical protein